MTLTTISGQTVGDIGEFGLIDLLRRTIPEPTGQVVLGVGDDTAAMRPTPGMLTLATCDVQVEGRHFIRTEIAPRLLGRRTAAVNLSDIAAMGGRPTFALVSLGLPQTTAVDWILQLYKGINDELGRFGAVVVGGNIAATSNDIFIDVTLLGEVEPALILRRDGARPGDRILITGTIGASAVGRMALNTGLRTPENEVEAVIAAHHAPQARVTEGRVIAATGRASAMIDISDGLAGDLRHICGASKVAAQVLVESLPIASHTRDVARALGMDPIHLALAGGEDYELALTCAPQDAPVIMQRVREATGTPVTDIGSITEGSGVSFLDAAGRPIPLSGGWDHFSKAAQ